LFDKNINQTVSDKLGQCDCGDLLKFTQFNSSDFKIGGDIGKKNISFYFMIEIYVKQSFNIQSGYKLRSFAIQERHAMLTI